MNGDGEEEAVNSGETSGNDERPTSQLEANMATTVEHQKRLKGENQADWQKLAAIARLFSCVLFAFIYLILIFVLIA